MSKQNKHIVECLLPFLVEKQDLALACTLISPDVISHLDQYTAHGREVWMQWVRFINSRRSVRLLDTTEEEIVITPDERVTASGRWKGLRKGEVAFSDPISATYKIEDGKIVEIWTKRTNYTFVLGPLMQSHLGVAGILLFFKLWCLFHPMRAGKK